jgi:hypothetical protein
MGGGIGQYALYRAEDQSLCLFSLVVPAGAATPGSRSSRPGAWSASTAGGRTKPSTAAWTTGAIRRWRGSRCRSGSSSRAASSTPLLPPADDIHYVTTISETPSISIHLLAERHRVRVAAQVRTGDGCGDAVPLRVRERAVSARAVG